MSQGLTAKCTLAKHSGKTWKEAADLDPEYVIWVHSKVTSTTLSPELVEYARKVQLAKQGIRPRKIQEQSTDTSEQVTHSLAKETNMSSNLLTKVTENNTAAIKEAAKQELGRTAINLLADTLKPHLPMMVRGYADSPIFKIALANVLSAAIQKYFAHNHKAVIVADAMMVAGYSELFRSFDIEGMLKGLLDKLPTDKLNLLVGQE